MGAAVETMRTQLKQWGATIEGLAAKTPPGAQARFDDLILIDELKALLAIAQARFDEYRDLGGTAGPDLKAELTCAWNEVEAAIKSVTPPSKAATRRARGNRRSE